jgi:rhodanese-related sulfurtransferase
MEGEDRQMKRMLSCCLVVLTSAALIGQLAPERIDLAEFRKLHAAKKVLVVDVRDGQSFADGHIPGAINIPLGEHEQAAHLKKLKAEKRAIVTYCA